MWEQLEKCLDEPSSPYGTVPGMSLCLPETQFLHSGLSYATPSEQMELQLLYPSAMVCASCAAIDPCIEFSPKAIRVSQVLNSPT